MNLSSLIFIALTTLFSGNLISQSSFNDFSSIDFTNQATKKTVSTSSYDMTASQSLAQIKDHILSQFTYPASMREYNIEGRSTVTFSLSELGTIKNVIISESLGSEFDYEILKVLRGIDHIPPVRVNGKAVSQKVIIPIQFVL